jgi:hypothetical protein
VRWCGPPFFMIGATASGLRRLTFSFLRFIFFIART